LITIKYLCIDLMIDADGLYTATQGLRSNPKGLTLTRWVDAVD